MLFSNRMMILGGFNQTVPFKPLPDLMVFNGWILSLFVLAAIAVTLLYSCKFFIRYPYNSPSKKNNLIKCSISLMPDTCEVIFLTQPLKHHLVPYFMGTFLLIWTSTSLFIFYNSYLSTKQLVFNPPHLIKSYKQIEKEKIKPLYASEMNDLALIERSQPWDAEYPMKKLIHRYGVDKCQIPVQSDPNVMSKVALTLQKQRDVIIINEAITLLTKFMMCSLTHNIQPNLTFYSHLDENAANNNMQAVYSTKFMATKTGRKMRQFIESLYLSTHIGRKAFEMMYRLADIFYFGSPSSLIARHKQTCASNYFEVLDPSVDPVENVIANAMFYLIGLALVFLFFESFCENTIGFVLNYHNRSRYSTFDQRRAKTFRPEWQSSRDKIVILNAALRVERY